MMRPDNSHKRDVIDALLDKSWENPPAHLKQQLMAIPTQITVAQIRPLDRITLFLNTVLILWGVGLVMYFWVPLHQMLGSFAQGLLGFGASSPQFLAHPIVGQIVFTCLLFGWVWMDMEKHPGVTKV
ncbi:MAG: hypothetical protein HOB84_00015 [Candidatus Marinimicrobia bacterium]|nr:hypothetical protein [Candidatus Neomarinimicrobiota bacterium]MBT4362741.1 hypothetical protein [Candidatus Neomarinimicrobiota bacterium]MBT4713139.1 hypothetical protein [Candidatus Neomarinimicrobiota bacterium]MBT4945873.1 hypothetical protein [Candidatus Neomarinimicrobiota bacterium]MBT5270496.1 hypothetical protein [Candidatus Neomarinimicrobiota bacterium]